LNDDCISTALNSYRTAGRFLLLTADHFPIRVSRPDWIAAERLLTVCFCD
jgi:hypothetical protein